MKRDIIVVTAAYGYQQVNTLGGQAAVLPIIAAAGADGVEIRRELLRAGEETQLTLLGQRIATEGLRCVYSVPEPLFTEAGHLTPQLTRYLDEAEQLGARQIKFALGGYRADSDCRPLLAHFSQRAVTLLVENDQTANGRLQAMALWRHHQGEQPLTAGLTFDMANWLWVGDDPRRAADSLAARVRYIHVKAAARRRDGWCAVALDDADDLWRDTLQRLPADAPRGIEFPLQGDDLVAVTQHYVRLLREESPS
ncbi:sugar phosphate isomerase/epimerase [Pantoea sp. 1.19]|uniref:sugar phosphate isomerase/epimerase family protein n=1 Tax=Pantoea sp. 1.19 TaxID=1925589 RepID=UPI0009488C2C|nr:TIM barrel protein [Pantoea sp. 1.19]